MASLSAIVIYLILFVLPFGQLLRVNFSSINFPFVDILIVLFSVLNILGHIKNKNLKPQNKYFLIFIPISLTSLLVNLIFYPQPFLKPFFYFIRLTSLLLLIIFPPSFYKPSKIPKYLVLSLFSCVTFGLIQYFFWPDLTYFASQNWDPHLNRLVGSFFDPSFTALIFLLFIIFLFYKLPNSNIKIILISITYLALALTYSRSTYLSIFLVSLFTSLKTRQAKFFIITSILLILTITLLPKPYGEGTRLDRTASIYAKIQNYKQALSTIRQSPLLGVGYNTLPNIKSSPQNHSSGGFDNGFLTIFATTGILGFSLFLIGFIDLYRQSSIFIKTTLLSITIHTFFANSLLYNWILLLTIIFLAFDKTQTIYHK